MKKLAKTLNGKLPKYMEEEAFVEMDRMALGAVRLTLSNEVRRFVIKENTLKGMLDTLSDMYEKPNAVQQLNLMRRLFTLKMGKGMSVRQQVGIVCDIIEQLASVDVEFDEHIKALVLLTSMPSDWDVTVNSICSGAGTKKKLNFNEVRDTLLNEEARRVTTLMILQVLPYLWRIEVERSTRTLTVIVEGLSQGHQERVEACQRQESGLMGVGTVARPGISREIVTSGRIQ